MLIPAVSTAFGYPSRASFNPATGLMLIPAGYFGRLGVGDGGFNPATGLMLIPARDRGRIITRIKVLIPRLG